MLTWLVRLVVPSDECESLLGDIAQEYEERIRPSRGWAQARSWHARQLLAACAYGIGERLRPVREQRTSAIRRWIAYVAADARLAVRHLRHSPMFSMLAIATLAIGIGAATAIFSTIYPVLLAPLPYPNANRLVVLSSESSRGGRIGTAFGTYLELRARARSFEALGVSDVWLPVFTGHGEAVRIEGERVSTGYLRVFGVTPSAGRLFDESDAHVNGPRVVIVSDSFVRRRLGAEPSAVVGQTVALNGAAYLVIGVLPRDFKSAIAPTVEIWGPLQFRDPAPLQGPEWGQHQRMIATLRSGVSAADAKREIVAIAGAPVAEFSRAPWVNVAGLFVDRLQDFVNADSRSLLLVIAGAVLLLLLLACVNVTNLLLARWMARRGEFAVRAALGASPRRLMGTQIVESLVLSTMAGTLGLMGAWLAVDTLVALAPAGLPYVDAIHLNGVVFGFTFAISLVVGLGVAIVPALSALRPAIHDRLASTSRRTIGGAMRARSVLVVAEVALALVLLVGAGLLLRSLDRLFSIAPGFDASHVVTMQLQVTGSRYASDEVKTRHFEEILDHVRAVPGVVDASTTSQLPLSGDNDSYGVRFESAQATLAEDDGTAFRYSVTPTYVAAMRIPLLRGRFLDERDRPGAPEAILINESLASSRFPGQDPIGQKFRAGPELQDIGRPWGVIVGIVGDVKQSSLESGPRDAFYVPLSQWPWVDAAQWLVVRTGTDPEALVPGLRRAIAAVDPDQAITRVSTMEQIVGESQKQRSFAFAIFEVFALTALVLAAIGLYGVLSSSIAERTREMGLRAALGATRAGLLTMVVRQGLMLATAGAAVGLATAALVGRTLATLLFEISPRDPLTYAGVSVVLAGVAIIACWAPAWRASRVDPLVALRNE